MLEGRVVQHVSTQHKGPLAIVHVPVPLDPLHVIPLLRNGKDIQDGDLIQVIVRCGVGGQTKVEFKVVKCPESQHSDRISIVRSPRPFVLVVVVDGQKRQANRLEQQLQIAPADTCNQTAVFACGSFHSDPEVARAHHSIGSPLICSGIFEAKFHHAAERVASRGGESPRVEVHPFHEVYVDHAHGPAARPLGGKVVDVGNFDAVEVEAVFVGRTPANDNVVSETRNGRHTRQGPKGPADVSASPGIPFDFIGADAPHTQRSFLHSGARFRHNLGGIHGNGRFGQRHVHHGRA